MNCEIWEQFSQELDDNQLEIIHHKPEVQVNLSNSETLARPVNDLLTDLVNHTKISKVEVNSNLSNHFKPQVLQRNKSKNLPKPCQKSKPKTTQQSQNSQKSQSVKTTHIKTNNSEKFSFVPAEEIKNKLSKSFLLVAASLSTVLLTSSLVLGYKGIGQLFSPSTENVDDLHPIDIPYITNPEQCKTNGNIWKEGQCLEYRNNPM